MDDLTNRNIETKKTTVKTEKFNLRQELSEINYKDPKIMAIIALVTILILLTLFTIILAIIKRPKTAQITTDTIPTPTLVQTTKNNIPESFRIKFETVEKQVNTIENFPPPEIDETIGL